MSEHLYNILPPNLKPPNRMLSLSQDAERHLIGFAGSYASAEDTATVRELDAMTAHLITESRTASRSDQISNYICIGSYYASFRSIGSRKGEWVPYAQKVIQLAGNDPAFTRQKSAAYLQLSRNSVNNGRYDEAITNCFTALDLAKQAADSESIRSTYSTVVETYASLALYRQALDCVHQSFQYLSVSDKALGVADVFLNDNNEYIADLYMDWYLKDRKKSLADSAWAYLHKIPLTGPHADWWNELFSYGMARYYFITENYTAALQYIAVSLANENYYADLHANKELIRDLCLLKTGKAQEAEKNILTNRSLHENLGLAIVAYKALYDHAKGQNNAPQALRYYELVKVYEDSAAVLQQQGKVLEIARKYDVRQKQSQLDMLAIKHKTQAKQRNQIIIGAAALTLLLLSVIVLLYALGKRRQVRMFHTRQSLADVQQRMENFLDTQEKKIKEEEEKATSALRQKISRDLHDGLSSTLAALRYYIGDMRLHRKNEKEQKLLMNIEEEVSSIYVQARDYMHNLHQNDEQSQPDLTGFLSNLSRQFSGTHGFRVNLQANTEEITEKLNSFQQTQLYFILKEAIANTVKHAGATQTNITVSFESDMCIFIIADDGRGMDTAAQKGLGLESISNRVKELDGVLHISSNTSGTRLSGSFPCSKAA